MTPSHVYYLKRMTVFVRTDGSVMDDQDQEDYWKCISSCISSDLIVPFYVKIISLEMKITIAPSNLVK